MPLAFPQRAAQPATERAPVAIDLDAIARRLAPQAAAFAAASPFPHLVLDDFLPADVADALAAEFDDPAIAWQPLHHVNERKSVFGDLARMGPVAATTVRTLYSPAMCATLERLTGITQLIGDPELDGAGLHRTDPGGHLNVHTDALAHGKRRTWSRQLNLIVFLNRDWSDAYRGELELWDADVSRCVQRIAPLFNRCVLFRTTPVSYHGVPDAVACPEGRSRKSLALYYFRDEARVVPLHPTHYVPRPRDPLARRLLIRADRALLRVYALLKRYTPIDDARVTRLLRRF
jgi:hypothetical protein